MSSISLKQNSNTVLVLSTQEVDDPIDKAIFRLPIVICKLISSVLSNIGSRNCYVIQHVKYEDDQQYT